MKVLISSDLAPPYFGGGETYTLNIGKALVKIGHEVHWITSKIPNTMSEEFLDGIKIHRVPIFYSSKYLFPGRQSFALTSLITGIKLARQVDIVQINTLVPGLTGWMISKYAKKPSVLYCHEFFNELWHKIGQNSLEKNIYPLAERLMSKSPYDWFACPSEYSKTTLEANGVAPSRITVIPHGVDDKPDVKSGDYRDELKLNDNFVIGYIGRLLVKKTGQSKNLITLLKAMKIVLEKIPSARLLVAGSGYDELKPFVHEMGLENNVAYIGRIPQEDVSRFFRTCDLVVCPALSDGFCFLLADASYFSVATVATSMGSHLERVDDGKTGLLSIASPEDIADKIVTLLEDDDRRIKMGHMGTEKYKNMTWEKSAKMHLDMYENVINHKVDI
ncbi:MAG: glycosyltransferase family 4 protein [Candidatus Aenigmarchaeota archaeon]|nr:glycosyltransferase family 4 protein [Candidatus Aenigmarchaeota archaeon]